ncbi:unnamed protein product, partial [Rotaria socialis]
LKLPDDDP